MSLVASIEAELALVLRRGVDAQTHQLAQILAALASNSLSVQDIHIQLADPAIGQLLIRLSGQMIRADIVRAEFLNLDSGDYVWVCVVNEETATRDTLVVPLGLHSSNNGRAQLHVVGDIVGGDKTLGDTVYRDKQVVYGNMHIYHQEVPIKTPWQLPELPRYVTRAVAEERLHAALLAHDDRSLILLHGQPGVGKSSLAAAVLRRLSKDDFPGGIFWGSLASLSGDELLLRFLGALDTHWHRDSSMQSKALREAFWDSLGQNKALIVIDDLERDRQLAEILPSTHQVTSKVLALSNVRLEGELVARRCYHQQLVEEFDQAEALELFRHHLGQQYVERHRADLLELAQLLEYVPQLLSVAAGDIAARKILVSTYIRELSSHESGVTLGVSGAIAALTKVLDELPPLQRHLLACVGSLDGADWSADMLSAIALQPLNTVREQLQELADRELIKLLGNGHYRTTMLVHAASRQMLKQETPYIQHAVHVLLAHYCLDRAQRLVDMARSQYLTRSSLPVAQRTRDEAAFCTELFRNELLGEVHHIRRAMAWSVEHKAWDILRRFALFPYVDRVLFLHANAYEVRLALTMATMHEPLIWPYGEQLYFQAERSLLSSDWSLEKQGNSRKGAVQFAGPTLLLRETPEPDERVTREISLSINAGQIVDGIFDSVSLIDLDWIGVQAHNLICKKVDVVGGQFLACDLRNNVWVDCDARQLIMHGTDLSHTLLRCVKLGDADLSGSNLSNAVLEEVDLRGATLRGAVFTDAVLEDVDLRSADLRDASFRGTTFIRVRLDGVQLAENSWAGAKLIDLIIEDSRLRAEIAEAQRRQSDTGTAPRTESMPGSPSERRRWSHKKLLDPSKGAPNLTLADLRGGMFGAVQLEGAQFKAADMRAAQLAEAEIVASLLSNADLRGADLAGATLCGSNLSEVDLRGANLQAAKLSGALLYRVQARRVYLVGAQLEGATLDEANLEGATLTNAILSNADLSRANLKGADLRWARLAGARLLDANCEGVDFYGSDVSDEQLQQALTLGGATLKDGRQVAVLAEIYGENWTPLSELSYAQMAGKFIAADLQGQDLRGASLSGTFSDVSFADANLQGARLSGIFSGVSFADANLQGARLSGIFVDVNFSHADLSDAQLSGRFNAVTFHHTSVDNATLRNASLVDCRLETTSLSPDQLQQALRLRASTLPDDTCYDGRFNLDGDREDARRCKINLDDPLALAAFCGQAKVTFLLP